MMISKKLLSNSNPSDRITKVLICTNCRSRTVTKISNILYLLLGPLAFHKCDISRNVYEIKMKNDSKFCISNS